ncbi:MAG TPA: hypothetical protein VNP72_03550 [Longimicrobium sp.]|nr:hypothetical protein [Longimicrobium sp.]
MRMLSLLLLACLAWTRAAAADCPAAPAAGPEPAHAHAPASAHTHHAPAQEPTQHHHPDGEHGGPLQHAGGGCTLVMHCGAAALPAAAPDGGADGLLPGRGMAAARAAYLSPVLGTDPPPPRAHPQA